MPIVGIPSLMTPRGGPNIFSPSDIAGLKMWLKADSLALNDADPVGTWTDSSGNGNDATQSTAANKPLFKVNIVNGWPVVRFDGSNDSLGYPAGITTTAQTAFVVGAMGVAAGSQTAYAPFFITLGTNGARICCRLSGTNWGTYGPLGAELSAGEDLTSGAFNVLAITNTSDPPGLGDCHIYRDGTQKNSEVDDATGGENMIGAETASSRWINADIAEVIVYNTVLSAGNRQLVEAYLKTKYATP